MHKLAWRKVALDDLLKIVVYIAADNPQAAQNLKDEIEAKAELARQRPTLYKVGRVKGTRELVISAHYLLVYRVVDDLVEVLRVLHTARQWPPKKP